jgi:hypothetical protein
MDYRLWERDQTSHAEQAGATLQSTAHSPQSSGMPGWIAEARRAEPEGEDIAKLALMVASRDGERAAQRPAIRQCLRRRGGRGDRGVRTVRPGVGVPLRNTCATLWSLWSPWPLRETCPAGRWPLPVGPQPSTLNCPKGFDHGLCWLSAKSSNWLESPQ